MRSLVFCTTCRHSADEPTGPDGLTGGERLARTMEALLAEQGRSDVTVRRQACLWACTRHCNVWIADSQRFSYLAGGFAPEPPPPRRSWPGSTCMARASGARCRSGPGRMACAAISSRGCRRRPTRSDERLRDAEQHARSRGARSGKSRHAEGLGLAHGGAMIYIATGEAGDAEMAQRIAHHRAARGPAWTTIEEPVDLARVLERTARPQQFVLVDCITLWISNLLAWVPGRRGCRRPVPGDCRGGRRSLPRIKRGRPRHRARQPARQAVPRRGRSRPSAARHGLPACGLHGRRPADQGQMRRW